MRWPSGAKFEFSKASRSMIPPEVVTAMRSLNQLDLRLYALATELFEERYASELAKGNIEPILAASES
jgi:hypothetical protein